MFICFTLEKHKPISLYWKCQLAGWTAASLYWLFAAAISDGFRWDMALAQLFTDILLYVSITHMYRLLAIKNNWAGFSMNRLVKHLFIWIPVMAIVYGVTTIIKIFVVRQLFSIDIGEPVILFTKHSGLQVLVAGARLMAIWLLAYHVYYFAKREIRLVRDNARLELSLKQAMLDNLSAQLNPHFLFNSLTTIKALIWSHPQSASRGVDLLGELLRAGIYPGTEMLVTVEEELALVKDYIELETLRLEDRLVAEFDTDVSLHQFRVPRFCIQALVENAIKHGIANRFDGGIIRIQSYYENDKLHLVVTSPGGITKEEGDKGIGLRNLRERLAISYQGGAGFSLSGKAGSVVASITIPAVRENSFTVKENK